MATEQSTLASCVWEEQVKEIPQLMTFLGGGAKVC